MNILIIGAGEVGRYLCEILSDAKNNVTVIESSPELATEIDEELNVRVLQGNGSSAELLSHAGIKHCDFLLAMTSDDRTNIVSSSIGKALGARTTIARIHDQTYSDYSIINYQMHFGIDHLLNPEALSAVELAKLIRNPGRVAVENFARGQIEVLQLRVHPKAKVTGVPLRELRLDSRIRVGYVQHGDHQEVATADTVLKEGALVTLFGPPQVLFDVKPRFNPNSDQERIRVVLYGGGETSVALIRLLSHPRFKIRVIERNEEHCRLLSERFPGVTVIHGDATSLRLLEEEQVGSTDYFVACTKDDEDNIMTCLQASKLGAKHVLLLINRADYIDILNQLKTTLGVELVVSPRIATGNEVMRFLSSEPYNLLAELPQKGGNILEIKVGDQSASLGMTFRQIQWPPDCVIVALLRQEGAKVPGADDTLQSGDRIVAIIEKGNTEDLVNLLH